MKTMFKCYDLQDRLVIVGSGTPFKVGRNKGTRFVIGRVELVEVVDSIKWIKKESKNLHR